MMVYIPDEWFRDIKNKDTVFDMFTDIPDTDIIDVNSDQEQMIEKRLSALEEWTILEHYQKGCFTAG